MLVGFPAAEHYLGFDGHPSTIYVRAETGKVNDVDNLLAATANPQNPGEVDVSQPSAALVAQADAQGAFDDLFLDLGAVALLVGAVGVANVMIISVLERRSEIGLRRALGATKGHIRAQFLAEAVRLALVGGAAGVGAGAITTAIYATPSTSSSSSPRSPGPVASVPCVTKSPLPAPDVSACTDAVAGDGPNPTSAGSGRRASCDDRAQSDRWALGGSSFPR